MHGQPLSSCSSAAVNQLDMLLLHRLQARSVLVSPCLHAVCVSTCVRLMLLAAVSWAVRVDESRWAGGWPWPISRRSLSHSVGLPTRALAQCQ